MQFQDDSFRPAKLSFFCELVLHLSCYILLTTETYFMKILLHYLKPHKWLVALVLTLAAINIGFSLVDPILFGKLINLANSKVNAPNEFDWNRFFNSFSWKQPGVWFIVLCSISVAMISR